MTLFKRFLAASLGLILAGSVLADDANIRVAVVVDMTEAGKKLAHPTPESPAYYVPVVIGYKELGDHLTDFQRPPPPADVIQGLLVKALAEQGYVQAKTATPPSLVLVFRWGYIAPQIVNNRFLNRDELMTYVLGDDWDDLAATAQHGQADPGTESLLSEINAATDISLTAAEPELAPRHGPATPVLSSEAPGFSPGSNIGARYFLMVSALDYQASRNHKSVLLWRAHVSVNYWGHYLDETLPTLIAAGAPLFGRETSRPQIKSVPVVPSGRVVVGTPVLVPGIQVTPGTAVSDRLQADTDKTLSRFAEKAQRDISEAPVPAPGLPNLSPPPTEQPREPEAPRQESPGAIVRLPPYIVTESRIHNRTLWRWRYVTIPGFEILSACSSAETEEFALNTFRQQACLDEIVPADLRASSIVPTTLILLADDSAKSMSQSLAALAQQNAARMNARLSETGVEPTAPPVTDLIPQVKLWDADSTGVDILLKYRGRGGYGTIEFDPDYVASLLARRTPPLPTWFLVGVISLYQDRFAYDTTAPTSATAQAGGGPSFGDTSDGFHEFEGLIAKSHLGLTTVQGFPKATWITPELTTALEDNPRLLDESDSSRPPRRMLPLSELVTAPPPPAGTNQDKLLWLGTTDAATLNDWKFQAKVIMRRGAEEDSPWRREIWRSQCMLFVRWCLDDDTYARAKALWKFAAEAATQPPTEALFRNCFGMNFADADGRLNEYLATALRSGFRIVPETPVDFPQVETRDPTEAEEARLLGDFQRKEVEFVRPSYPEYADDYATQADRTLRRAYNDGERDPGLLAALGIFECTVGDDADARKFLEEAVQRGVTRPRAYIELARIRLNAALAKPAGLRRALNREQVSFVLGLIGAVRAQQPAQLNGYLLAAEAWEHADFVPTPADLRLLDEGLYYFPRDPRLILAAAQLDAAAGLKVEAIRVLDGGLRNVSSPRVRGVFEALRTRYSTQPRN